jgi:pimeloyl-ACP methyl ester carboxylesterase
LLTPRAGWLVFARNGLLVVVGLCALSALIEYVLERRDAARLTANETFYTVEGRRIRYHQTGPSTPGPTIVLLNAGAGSLEQWDSVQTALSTQWRVVSYDRGGLGFSDPADAHDASANADELDQLLHAPQIAGPFMIVSYSSSSMAAIVFAAKHLDVVRGMVFVDPTMRLPTLGKTYRRIFLRPSVIYSFEAFFGYRRLQDAIDARNAPPSSVVSQRWMAIAESTHHWVATVHDWMEMDESSDEVDVVLAAGPFADLPLGVLTTGASGDSFAGHKKLVAGSNRAILRPIHADHTRLLIDPVAIASVVELIRTVAGEVRAEAAAGSESP